MKNERGQIVPLVAVVILFIGICSLTAAKIGFLVNESIRAQTAADAAALAGALHGEDAARDAARANGAQLLTIRGLGGDSLVVIKLGSHTATARARTASADMSTNHP